jgi:hypothetical protein
VPTLPERSPGLNRCGSRGPVPGTRGTGPRRAVADRLGPHPGGRERPHSGRVWERPRSGRSVSEPREMQDATFSGPPERWPVGRGRATEPELTEGELAGNVVRALRVRDAG